MRRWADTAMNSREEFEQLIRQRERGFIAGNEFVEKVFYYVWRYPDQRSDVANQLANHPDAAIREALASIQDLFGRIEEQIRDVTQIRRSSPLRPGSRLVLDGGYDVARPFWLNGREYYAATFIQFAECGSSKMPVALVELDEEVDVTEASGLRHRGRYAILRLRYLGNWTASETVTVHIVEVLPQDLEAFYSSHPFGTEIESHATYRIAMADEIV